MDISNVILSSNYGLPHPLNAQTIFDKCAMHLIHQGRRSINRSGCVYRGEDGAACAVGALISDERYTREMENQTAYSVTRMWISELEPFAYMLGDLQDLHDHNIYVNSKYEAEIDFTKLIRGLLRIADEHKVSAEVLTALAVGSTLPAEITSLLRPSLAKTEA